VTARRGGPVAAPGPGRQALALSVSLLALLIAACGSAPESGGGDELHVRCLDKPDLGVCRPVKPAYFYDYRTDTCQRFLWGGCGGNPPFPTAEECVDACGGHVAR